MQYGRTIILPKIEPKINTNLHKTNRITVILCDQEHKYKIQHKIISNFENILIFSDNTNLITYHEYDYDVAKQFTDSYKDDISYILFDFENNSEFDINNISIPKTNIIIFTEKIYEDLSIYKKFSYLYIAKEIEKSILGKIYDEYISRIYFETNFIKDCDMEKDENNFYIMINIATKEYKQILL
jgi:hypothetical protein